MTNAEPQITVIIPTFRRPQLLRRAILSVLNQTFSAFLVCVYDDASNEDTQKVVSDLAATDSRIKYHRHKQNIGALANFNYGLKEVYTPFFLFLSDDDLILPHFFEVAMQYLGSYPDAMFYGGLTIVVKDNNIVDISKNGGHFGYFLPPHSLLDIMDHHLMWNSIIFRSTVVKCVGLLDVDVRGPADLDFEFRVAAHYPVIISTEPSAIYTLHTQNFSSDYRLYLPGFKRIIDKMTSDESLSLQTKHQIKKRLSAWLAHIYIDLAERATLQGEFDRVSDISEILLRFCNKKAYALLLVSRLKLKEASEPAFCLVSWIERFLRFTVLGTTNKIKLSQLQKKYGEYLRYLNS